MRVLKYYLHVNVAAIIGPPGGRPRTASDAYVDFLKDYALQTKN